MNSLQDNVLGLMYIAEQTSPDEKPRNLEVHDSKNIFFVEFMAALHSFGILNRNGRGYISSNINDAITLDKKIQAHLRDNGWFGEMNHPMSIYKDKKLSSDRIGDIKMDNTSHKIINPVVSPTLLTAKIQTDSGCEAGINMAKKIIQGLIPAFSCRAIAGIQMLNRMPTVIVRKLITYDWVFYPSHEEAHQTGPIKAITKGIDYVSESSAIDVSVLLSELLAYAGKKNVNAQIIMESFQLDESSLIGFSKGANHIIMRDNTNTIYCDMDYALKREVNSYLTKL